jgi:hypothetical protein
MPTKTPRFARACELALALSICVPIAADGQNVSGGGNDFRTAGLWWELGLGAASSRLSCNLCDPDREAGPVADLAVGAYATPRLRVGVHGGIWHHNDEGDRESVYRAGVLAQFHPRPASGLHLIGGAGWSGYRAGVFGANTMRLTFGAGWDLPFADGWLVGNNLMMDASAFGALKNEEETVARGVGLSVLRLGVFLRRR